MFLSLSFVFAILTIASIAFAGCSPESTIDSQAYISPDGVEFTITTSNCKQHIHNPRDVDGVTHEPLNIGVVERGASECTDPDICACGQTCSHVTCKLSLTGFIFPSDCQKLTSAIHATLEGTFFLDPGESKTANSGSCQYLFLNEGSTELEYCWDDFGTLGQSMTSHCPLQQAACQINESKVSVVFNPY